MWPGISRCFWVTSVLLITINDGHCFIAFEFSGKDTRGLSPFSSRSRTNEEFQKGVFNAWKASFLLDHQHDSALDDDDISQHDFMDESTTVGTDAMAGGAKKTGYRSVEDWHEEDVAKNPQHALTRLQQERAQWKKKYEDLGGDGI